MNILPTLTPVQTNLTKLTINAYKILKIILKPLKLP